MVDCRDDIYSVAFLVDGKHVVSGGREGKIRRWRFKDGKEVGTTMDMGSRVRSIAVSRDGKWIISGTRGGQVTVWDAESRSKVSEFKAHNKPGVRAVDVSPDATKIVTGSNDCNACVWSLSTGERLLGPLKHIYWVVAAKFSPDGRLVATATWECDSVRVYDSQNGSPVVEFPVQVNSNHSLAWATDSRQLFALSHDGCIHRVDVSAKTTLSKWHIHSSSTPTCIALVNDGAFIAATAHSSASFWDTNSQEQIGTVIEYTHYVQSMVMSSNYDLVTCGEKRITLGTLRGILPAHYFDSVSVAT